uniref:CCHC-type domain-containing protein n=1 Tax=Cannabis sativa TaxID=3483 RepID=A0A803NJT0_CANSA
MARGANARSLKNQGGQSQEANKVSVMEPNDRPPGEDPRSPYFISNGDQSAINLEFRPQSVYTCGAMKAIQEYQDDDDRVLEFLIGLNESYAYARSQILMQDPFPKINKAFASVVQEERPRGIVTNHSEGDKTALPTSSNSSQFAGSVQPHKPKTICHNCGVQGHIMAKCYRLHGYPPGHKLHGKFPNKNALGTNKAPTTNFSDVQKNGENSGGGESIEQDFVATFAQCQRLMSLLSQKGQEQQGNEQANQPTVSQLSGYFEDTIDWDGEGTWKIVLS